MSQQGSIRKRGGTWTAYWFVRNADGTRRQRSKGGFRTKGDARSFLNSIMTDVDAGTHVEPTKMTLKTYLYEHWLPALTQRETTRSSYRWVVETWITPLLGGEPLSALTPGKVQRFVDELREGGGRRGKKLSDRSVQYAVVVLRMALKQAVRSGFIPRNPAAAIDRPRSRRREMKAWSADEAGRFLDVVAGDRLYTLWLLGVTRGLRRGELAGLRWTDVDLDVGRLSVVHTRVMVDGQVAPSEPKTEKGRRSVPLDADLVAALRDYRRQQIEERLAWGEGWQDTGYVFTREDGAPLHPEYLSGSFDTYVRRAKLTRIRFHDMRHTAATLSLQAGIPTKVVSEWLGHSSTAITEDLYRHAIPSMQEEAGALLTSLIMSKRQAR